MRAVVESIGEGSEPAADLGVLDCIQRRVLWLSTLMIHEANRVRPNTDGLKVGGHQASSASVVSILTSLFFDFLRAEDQVSVKPHASPALHAIHYLLGNLDRHFLTRLRAFHGLQSYPSRTKDPDRVDFSTGSVGLGCVAPNFAALVERYVTAHFGSREDRPRFISIVGDAELDEGSVWEAIVDPALDGLDNIIWIVDLNRQSLDRVIPGVRAERLRNMFRANDWEVIDAKYGSRLEAAFRSPGGEVFRRCIDDLPNADYQRLLRLPPENVRQRLIGASDDPATLRSFLDHRADGELAGFVGDLGGHDLGVLRRALEQADAATRPCVIFAYTVKGWGLPIAGDPLNHSALLTHAQMEDVRKTLGVAPGTEYDRFPDDSPEGETCRSVAQRLLPPTRPTTALSPVTMPSSLGNTYPRETSSQGALSLILSELARSHGDLAQRMVTASPDVATSTNLGGWINKVGVFNLREHRDPFNDAGPRLLNWDESPTGRHIELGISETNLFLLLGQLGLSGEKFGEPLFPIGTLYDPFICRGLDALMYGVYSGSRFITIATPSGVTLSPEGGAHQSTITPSIGLELPRLTSWEPCFALETEWILLEALRCLRDDTEGSSYIRLSTKPVNQELFTMSDEPDERDRLRHAVLSGAYRLLDHSGEPGYDVRRNVVTIVASGAMIPEALLAAELLRSDDIFANVVNVTSPSKVYGAFHGAMAGWVRNAAHPPVSTWLDAFPGVWDPGAPVVSVLDGHPHTFAWIPAALRSPGVSLGVTDFGQSGATSDLYGAFQIDADSIAAAGVALLLESNPHLAVQ